MKKLMVVLTFVCLASGSALSALAQEKTGDARAEQMRLAKMLENPVANLISLPIQNNFDFGFGSKNAMRYTLNVQPVIPFSLNKDWNLITRTILPYIYAESPEPGVKSKSGLSDITQSFFFSPSKPVGGYILGAGPVFRYPSATDKALGGEKWGAGPTALVFRQEGPWTYGMLVNHLWSFAGSSSRNELNATLLQPALAYSFPTATTVSLSSESLYDWEARQWTVPINLNVSQMLMFGKQPVRLQLGGRYYAESPPGGPEWGMRFQVLFPFPK